MSHRASAYAKTLIMLPATGKKLTASQKLLLMVLADYYNDEEKAAWPSMARLAKESLISRRHAITVLQDLAEGGVLEIEHRKAADGGNRSNRYRLIEIDPSEHTSLGGRGGGEPKKSPPSELQRSGPGELATSPKPVVNDIEREKEDGSSDPLEKHLRRYEEQQRLEAERKKIRHYKLR